MDWVDAIGCMVEIVTPILELIVDCNFLERRENPRRPEPDDWKCPDSDEITRVLTGQLAPANGGRTQTESALGDPFNDEPYTSMIQTDVNTRQL